MHLFKIGYCHTSGIRQNIRNHWYSSLIEYCISLRCDGTIGELHDQASLNICCIITSDLVLERRRDEDITVSLQQSRVSYFFSSYRVVEGFFLGFDTDDFIDIEPLAIIESSARIRSTDEDSTLCFEKFNHMKTGIPGSLNDNLFTMQCLTYTLQIGFEDVESTLCGRGLPTQ